MPHKILIEIKTDPIEVVQYQYYVLIVTLKNIGITPFPGGKITKFHIRYSNAASQSVTLELPDIPSLEINESFEYRHSFPALSEGIAWTSISINSNDDEQVEYYQTPKVKSPSEKEWSNLFNIRNRDNLEIITLLKSLIEKIDSIDKRLGVK